MLVILLASLALAEASEVPLNERTEHGRRRRRRRRRQHNPTPAPTPLPELCDSYSKSGMTWDCGCKAHAGGCVLCGGNSNYPAYRSIVWWFSPCSKRAYKCAYARRRKKFTSVCGNFFLGQTGNAATGQWEPFQNNAPITPNTPVVARFTVDLNGWHESKYDGAKGKFFWGDDNELAAFRIGWEKKGGCSAGYLGGGRCKCTCVFGKNMLNTGDMKAMIPYRGPGDTGLYKPPWSHGNWDDRYGKHNLMYGTYCIGVCGADCDGPNALMGGGMNNIPVSNRFGKNKMYAVLVAHDVCQAYIGSKDPADHQNGVRNGCGDEVFARNWKDSGSPATQGASAAGGSLENDGLSCDMGA